MGARFNEASLFFLLFFNARVSVFFCVFHFFLLSFFFSFLGRGVKFFLVTCFTLPGLMLAPLAVTRALSSSPRRASCALAGVVRELGSWGTAGTVRPKPACLPLVTVSC